MKTSTKLYIAQAFFVGIGINLLFDGNWFGLASLAFGVVFIGACIHFALENEKNKTENEKNKKND